MSRNPLALLADSPGLGKTVQAIRAADLVLAKKVLVICPAVARVNWKREFERWGKIQRRVEVLEGLNARVSKATDSAICSFEYATHNAEYLREEKWDRVVIDETHFLKSVNAKRTAAVFGTNGIVRSSRGIWALSGTPAPNNASELWVLMYSFGVTKLSQSQFTERYCDTICTNYGLKVTGTKKAMLRELKELLSRIMLRRRIEEVMPELPSIFFHEPMVVAPGHVEGLDAELKKVLAKESGQLAEMFDRKSLSDDEKLKLLEGLAQSISTLRRYTGLQKVDPACELIAGELGAGLLTKIVVFAIHKEVISRLFSALTSKKIKCVVVNGATTPTAKQIAIDSFQNDASVSVFIGNIQSAGPSITLTAAHEMLFLELDFVPGNNAQAAGRCRRIGQKKPVIVRILALDHFMDERVAQSLKNKIRDLTEIFDSP